VIGKSDYIFETNFGKFGLTRDLTRSADGTHPCTTLSHTAVSHSRWSRFCSFYYLTTAQCQPFAPV